MNKNEVTTAQILIADPRWRLNNLYYIVDKAGNKVKFKLNWAQNALYDEMHYLNLILKSRQLGISTFVCLLFLDRCLFNSNISAGIIAHTKDDAEVMFRRVKFAFDNLPEEIKALRPANNDTAQMLSFSNGSSLRVGTSMRSSSLQLLHISEMGKIAAKYPEKAREIVTGSLNALAAGQYVFVESTAEGREGVFFDLCKEAQALKAADKKLTPLDFKFFFFPWFKHKDYWLEDNINIPIDLVDYFKELEESHKIQLHQGQKVWYAKKWQSQKEDMKREYPSTPEESFQASTDGFYYSKYLVEARLEKRIGEVPYEKTMPVYVAMDLGFHDATSIWWYQVVGQQIRFIDFFESSGEPLTYYLKIMQDKPYCVERYFGPHDLRVHDLGSGLTRVQTAENFGITLIPVEKIGLQEGIDGCRHILNRCWFDEKKCEKGIRSLDNYRKEWNQNHGCWSSKPVHDFSSNGCDAFRYAVISISSGWAKTKSQIDGEYKESMRAVQNYLNPSGGAQQYSPWHQTGNNQTSSLR